MATKSPTFKSFRSLPDNTSFCLSPTSAMAVSSSISNARSPQPSTSDTQISLRESKVDGRRKLFPVTQKSVEERIQALESAALSIEVITRECSSKLDMVLMNLGRIVRSQLPSEKRITKPHAMPNLPLENTEALYKFESFLEASDANLSAVCDYMSNYVRSSVVDPERKSSSSILAHLLTNNVAKGMNLDGGNGKIGFRSLNLYKVFQGTLQFAFKDSDLSIADDALQKWLKDAKWRKQLPAKKPPSVAA